MVNNIKYILIKLYKNMKKLSKDALIEILQISHERGLSNTTLDQY
jgi:hypothetical protein